VGLIDGWRHYFGGSVTPTITPKFPSVYIKYFSGRKVPDTNAFQLLRIQAINNIFYLKTALCFFSQKQPETLTCIKFGTLIPISTAKAGLKYFVGK